MTRQHVFLIGFDALNLARLRRLPGAGDCEFHSALDFGEIRGVESFDVAALLDRAMNRITTAGVPVDGLVACYDFPASTMLPILAERLGVPGPNLESVFKCEHKYWSRLEQLKDIPDHIPKFVAFDPCGLFEGEETPLPVPFWIKPVKSFRSHLGFLVSDGPHFRAHAAEICRNLDYVVRPFQDLMRGWHMPAEITEMRELCLAETLISGAQCTAEGYVYNGEVVVYGIVDSVREHDRSSFARYQYPSMLPLPVSHTMIDLARRVVRRIGLDNTCFNVEFFWDQSAGRVWLLEINPRLSQSHCEIFELVHGVSHFAHMLDLALGRAPAPLPHGGEFSLAANCHLRVYQDGEVMRIPSQAEIRHVAETLPGTLVDICVAPGDMLSTLPDQDSYSFEVGHIVVGGDSEQELLDKYHWALGMLTFEIARADRSLDLEGSGVVA